MSKIVDKTKLWEFAYTPKTFDEMVLNPKTRDDLKLILENQSNAFLISPRPGMGKGTFVDNYVKYHDCDMLKINVADENGIDTVRDKIKTFATAMGMRPAKKLVFLNECDRITNPFAEALKQLIEDVQHVTRFIMACNRIPTLLPEISEPLFSRFKFVEFQPAEYNNIANYIISILSAENVSYDNKTLVEIIKKGYPDIRKIINLLQFNVRNNKLVSSEDYKTTQFEIYEKLLDLTLKKDFNEIRKNLNNKTVNYNELYEYMFENADKFKNPGEAIILIGEHLHRNNQTPVFEINFITMIMKMLKTGVI